jgi:hypothetical protein
LLNIKKTVKIFFPIAETMDGKKMKYCFLVRDTAYIATFPLSSTIQIKQKKMLKEQKQKQRKKEAEEIHLITKPMDNCDPN